MCRDGCESLPTTSVGINMMAGGIAGIFEHCIMYPLDSVKTRMQSLLPSASAMSISSTFWNMVNSEGKLRPVRGISAVIIGAGPGHALYFGSYEITKQIMSDYTTHNINYMSSAVVATFVHAAVATPMEAVKQRLQMYKSPYRNVYQCVRGVYSTEGVRAFYRSYGAQVAMNIPHQVVHFTTYEFLANHLNKERKYNPPFHVVAGGLAGGMAAAVTTPMDVVKTLLNTQETGLTRTMPEAIKQIYKAAGPKGFFKGITARVLYTMPATAICWSTYEFFKFYLCGVTPEIYKSSISGKHYPQQHEHHHAEVPAPKMAADVIIPETGIDVPSDKIGGDVLLIQQPPISEVSYPGSGHEEHVLNADVE